MPVPGGPSSTTFLRLSQEVELGEVRRRAARLTLAWTVKSKSSSVLLAGKRAALTRAWPPWLSRLSVSVFKSAAATCSNDHR